MPHNTGGIPQCNWVFYSAVGVLLYRGRTSLEGYSTEREQEGGVMHYNMGRERHALQGRARTAVCSRALLHISSLRFGKTPAVMEGFVL